MTKDDLISRQPETHDKRTETHACDLIDRQAAIDALGEAPKFKIGLLKKYAEGRNDQWFDDVAALVKLPSEQPEIVRCKDCKHWIPYDWMFSEIWRSKNIADYPEDEIGCAWCDMSMKADDFCSRGERREDG